MLRPWHHVRSGRRRQESSLMPQSLHVSEKGFCPLRHVCLRSHGIVCVPARSRHHKYFFAAPFCGLPAAVSQRFGKKSTAKTRVALAQPSQPCPEVLQTCDVSINFTGLLHQGKRLVPASAMFCPNNFAHLMYWLCIEAKLHFHRTGCLMVYKYSIHNLTRSCDRRSPLAEHLTLYRGRRSCLSGHLCHKRDNNSLIGLVTDLNFGFYLLPGASWPHSRPA